MALQIEGVVDGGVHTEEALRRPDWFEALHLVLSPSNNLMRVFSTIIHAQFLLQASRSSIHLLCSRIHLLSGVDKLVRDVLPALLSSLAKLERTKISERTKAGLERACQGQASRPTAVQCRRPHKAYCGAQYRQELARVSAATGIPFSTFQSHARLLGYSPPVRQHETRHGGWPSG
jgi:hypothetical protein